MKKLLLILLFFPLVYCNNSPIYIGNNGITIKVKKDVENGFKYELGGILYTVVDELTLREMIKNNEDVSRVITSNVTDMSKMFLNATFFNQNIESWDTTNVTSMASMFNGANSFNRNIGSWRTSNVKNMNRMFNFAYKFNQDITDWDTSNVSDTRWMFGYSVSFNQDVGNWNTSRFFNMNYMFYKTLKFNQDISGWCVTNFLFEPEGFSFDSALIKINKPIWGNCSTNLPSSILSSQL